jgi:hypothetical protein
MNIKNFLSSSKSFLNSAFLGALLALVPVIYAHYNDLYTRVEHIRQEKRERLDSALSECDQYRFYTMKIRQNKNEIVPSLLLNHISRRVAFDGKLGQSIFPFIQAGLDFDAFIRLNQSNSSFDEEYINHWFDSLRIDSLSRLAIDSITKKFREVSTND